MTDRNRIYALLWLFALPVVNSCLTVFILLLTQITPEGYKNIYGSLKLIASYMILAPYVVFSHWTTMFAESYIGKAYIILALLPLLASCIAWIYHPCRKTFFITLLAAFVLFGPVAMWGIVRVIR